MLKEKRITYIFIKSGWKFFLLDFIIAGFREGRWMELSSSVEQMQYTCKSVRAPSVRTCLFAEQRLLRVSFLV